MSTQKLLYFLYVKLMKQIKTRKQITANSDKYRKKFKNNSTGMYANLALTKKNKQKNVSGNLERYNNETISHKCAKTNAFL